MDALFAGIEALLGTILVVVSLASAFRTVVLPGAAFDRLSRGIFLGLRTLLRAIARSQHRYDQEAVFSVHAPLGLLVMALAWATGIMLGFGLLFHATAEVSFQDAFVLAGSSFTTLGFMPPDEGIHELLAISAAILGLGIVAMLLSYLPTIYGLYSRREVTVADVSIKSGGRAHGPDLLLRLSRGPDTRRIDDLWADWGHWLIALGETHTSEPSLSFFRSPREQRSWLAAASAVLDASIVRNVVVDRPESLRADMTYRAGVEAMVSIADFFAVGPTADADLVTRLTRADFDAMVAQLDAAELPVVPDLDRAWETFAPMRAAFEPALLGLCRLLLPPPSRWGADLLARPEPR
jgi:hypothetical protein